MADSIETYIETEARERNLLRYEAVFWGAMFAVAAIGAGFLLFQGFVLTGLVASAAALYSYIKRDETREEYMLKLSSGRDGLAARHWAEELGLNRLVGHKAPQIQQTAALPTNQLVGHKAPQIQQDMPHSNPISEEPNPHAASKVDRRTLPNQLENQRADGKSWSHSVQDTQGEINAPSK